jgi:RND family efflux transporter MFP subunit
VKQDGEVVIPQAERKTMTLVPAPEPQQNRPRRHWITLVVAPLIVAAAFAASIVPRVRARTALKTETAEMAVPAVSIVHPQTSGSTQEIVLPGNVQPFITSPIFARTNGYLKKWYVDIGGRVRKDQLLAEIETPEVDQQLRQSLSNLATAEANLRLAEITKDRYAGLLKTNAVAQQDVDNAVGTYNANKAIVEANQANVKQLETMQSFEKIFAPFDGIVTARNTDIGDLINSGSSGGPQTDLFHISQPGKLRVFVSVPQDYCSAQSRV